MQRFDPSAIDLATAAELNQQVAAAQPTGQLMESLIRKAEKTIRISLSFAKPTEPFAVGFKLQGLPRELTTLPNLMSISVEHGGKVIAHADMLPHNGEFNTETPGFKWTQCFATLSVKNPMLFQKFAETVLRVEEVEVVLRTTIYNVPIERVLKFTGFNAFQTLVVLSKVKIEGSDAKGESVQATVTAKITNTSGISITHANLTADVYYKPEAEPEAKIGYAEIKELTLQPKLNECEFRWTFKPAKLDDSLRRFILRYLLTTEKIPVLLRVTSIDVKIWGYQCHFLPLDLKATVEGIRSQLIHAVFVYIGGSILAHKFSFQFEFENPVDSPLTILDIHLEIFTIPKPGTSSTHSTLPTLSTYQRDKNSEAQRFLLFCAWNTSLL